MRHLLIDTDTASDDAVALILALHYPNVKVEAITVVAGNVPVHQGVQNALYTAKLCGHQIPVYQGSTKPILRSLKTAEHVHGKDGMGDIGLELTGREPCKGNAIDIIIGTINAYPHDIELVTLGPLTNIAIAILKEPNIIHKVKQCTIMGGIGSGHGNITPVSEYNFWVDPEAAQIVVSSGMKIQMVGWDISRKYAFIDEDELANIKAIGSPLASFSLDIQQVVNQYAKEVTLLPGFDLPDPIAMAVALDPSIATRVEEVYVEVVLANDLTRGQTVIDLNGNLQKSPTINVVIEASREKFLSLLHKSLS